MERVGFWRRRKGRRPAARRGPPAAGQPPPRVERGRPHAVAARYGFGAALAALAFEVERQMLPSFAFSTFLLFYPGVFITSLVAGTGPAALNLALAAAGAAWLLTEGRPTGEPPMIAAIQTALFVVFSGAVAWLVHRGRRAELALAESERRLRIFKATTDNSSDFIGIADPDGTPIYVNPAGRAMVGLDPDRDVSSTLIPEYYPEETRAFARDVILKTMLERGSWKGVTSFRNFKTNAVIPVWDEHYMIREPGTERVLGMGTITRDITERLRMEEQLRSSREDLRRAQEVARIGSWRLDVARDELVWSEQTFKLFGLPVGAPLAYQDFLSFVHPDDRRRVDEAWQAALRGAPYEIEHRIVVGGETRWVSERAELEFDAAGKAVRGVGTVQDVTARKRAEETLSQLREQERFRSALETAASAMVVATFDGTIVWINGEAERLFGWTRDELAGRSVETLIPQRLRADVQALRRDFAQKGALKRVASADRDLFALRKDGTEIPVEVILTRVRENGREFEVASLSDITLRKKAEAALRDSEQRLRLLVHDTREYAIFMHDLEGRVTVWNEGAQRIYGYTEEEALGSTFDRFYCPEDRAAGVPHADLRAAVEKGSHYAEAWRVRKDGSRFWASMVATPIYDAEGRHLGYGKVVRDLTERRNAEKALEDTAERLRGTVLDLESFAYTISHDLRSPLRAIQGYAHFLFQRLGTTADSDSRRMLSRMEQAAMRLDVLIRDLLSFNAVARQEVKLQPVDLDESLAHVADHYPELSRAELRVRAPLGKALAQPSLVIQMLSNLLLNAVKFVPRDRKPEIDVSTERRHGKILISVRDNGIGIAKESMPRLFKPFERLQRAEEYPGTGMGLAIVKRAVERMGGTVAVASEPGQGSVFTVTLAEAR